MSLMMIAADDIAVQVASEIKIRRCRQ